MAITPEEYQKRIDKALQALHKKLPDIIDSKALNQKQVFRERVTQRGQNVNSSGSEVAFPDYSKYYGRKKDETHVTPDRLLMTGDMLRKLTIVRRDSSNGRYTATLGGSDQFAQDKLNYNGEKFGDILKPSNEEVVLLEQSYLEDIADVINEVLEG